MTQLCGKQVTSNKQGKEVNFPADVQALTKEYNKTESGLFYKVLKVMSASESSFARPVFSTHYSRLVLPCSVGR